MSIITSSTEAGLEPSIPVKTTSLVVTDKISIFESLKASVASPIFLIITAFKYL